MGEIMDKIIELFGACSQLVVLAIGLYVLFESFTAINEMPKTSVRKILHELRNPYTLKYWLLGLYAMVVIYHSGDINGYDILLITPAIICVMNRTMYRFRHENTFGYLD